MKWLRYALVALCMVTLKAGGGMDPMQTEKVERFKKRIDFDAALRGEGAQLAVSATWPNMLEAPSLGAGPWQVAADTTWRSSGGVARQWVMRRGAEQLAIEIFVSSEGPGPARRFLLSRATENMMVDSPFVKGPPGLGSFAVSMPPAAPPNLIWVFHNVCVDVRVIDAQVDAEAIARWLQAIAQAGVVKSEAARPRAPGALHVSSRKAAVGVPIDISVLTASPADESRFMIELDFDPEVVDVVSQERLAARIRGRRVARTAIDLYLIDTETLLSGRSRIEIEFF